MFIFIFLLGVFLNNCESFNIVPPGPKFPATKGEVWPKPQHELKTHIYYTFNPSYFNITVSIYSM